MRVPHDDVVPQRSRTVTGHRTPRVQPEYLLAEGSGRKTIGGVKYDSPTYDGSTVKGIGRTKATAIFYRALTRYMVSTTDFHDARNATLKAAKDLYGANSTEYNTVDQAWAAVNVTTANTPAAHR